MNVNDRDHEGALDGGDTAQLHESWQVLADGLAIQRVHLHLGECQEIVESQEQVPDVAERVKGTTLTAALPVVEGEPTTLLDAAGVQAWVSLPARYGYTATSANPLEAAARTQGEELVSGEAVWARAVRAASGCAGWWVGFFVVLRHRGVHHHTLTPVTTEVSLATLERASRMVALGLAMRVLETYLRSGGEEAAEVAYCRAIAASIEAEREMPSLLEELGELRLVDLVSLGLPWRGRFTQYAGGTGAGQTE